MSLRQLREDQVLGQRDLAARAGISQQTIVDIEAGRITPRPQTVRKLATALGIEPAALLVHLRADRPKPKP